MVKFSSEHRKQVVQEYLTVVDSTTLCKKFKVASKQTILDWVQRYQKFGIEAFQINKRKTRW